MRSTFPPPGLGFVAATLKRPVRGAAHALGLEIQRRHPSDETAGYREQHRLLRGLTIRTILDIGAFAGDSAAQYRRLFPHAHVHCFEPCAASAEVVRTRFRGDGLVSCHSVALAEQPGFADLHRTHFRPATSLLAPELASATRHVPAHLIEQEGVDQVECTTVDEFRSRHGISRIGVLKLDVQGSELAVLRGARNSIVEQRIDLIYTELLFVRLYADQANYHEVCALLDAHGYALYDLYDLTYTSSARLGWCDGLFVRRSILEGSEDSGHGQPSDDGGGSP